MENKVIKTEEDYRKALKRLDAIFDSMPNSPGE
jgi:antitoxin component HigA of HigAB toxin-antitoxin module